jgi:molybdopterin-containing oxidoreductase family iron-sulfur binding subunit
MSGERVISAAALREQVRRSLAGKQGRTFWKSLDQLAGTPAFQAFLEAEFPAAAPFLGDVDRRSFLKAMAASIAMTGLAGCSLSGDPEALPYVNSPEFTVPGNPRWYATAVTLGGYAQPVLGKTHAGRPVKLEANPDHPAGGQGTDAFTQAALLGLYDPDRLQAPRRSGKPVSWDLVDAAFSRRAAVLDRRQGAGFRLLTGAVTSPTMIRQIGALMRRWPKARWHVLEPLAENMDAAVLAFGKPLSRRLRPDRAAAVVSFGDDFLGPGPFQTVNAARWAERRRAQRGGSAYLMVAEPTPTLTGIAASDRLIASPYDMADLVLALANALEIPGAAQRPLSDAHRAWVTRAASVLRKSGGAGLVTVGDSYPAALQAAGFVINEALDALGETVEFTEPIIAAPPDRDSMATLAQAIGDGEVDTLLAIDADPVLTASANLKFGELLRRVPFRACAGLHVTATMAACEWQIPLEHELETWTDARAMDGTASIVQPLVRPFYAVRSRHRVLDMLAAGGAEGRDIVKATWRAAWGADFDARWREALYRGFVKDSAAATVVPALGSRPVPQPPARHAGLTAVIQPDESAWDGRFVHNAWLQELPRPVTKVTWTNVVRIAPRLAEEHGLRNGDEVRVKAGGGDIVGPAWIVPGQAAGTVILTLGYGQAGPDRIGYDAYRLRTQAGPWHVPAVVEPTGRRIPVASTQLHQAMDGYDFVRTVTMAELAEGRPIEPEGNPSLYPSAKPRSPSWGMSIDLDLCIGCNACVAACVAENNIPMVGPELIAQGREMHWLRVDHYNEGDPDDPKSYFQPVPCMHCEQAPCEMGCPVNASVHSSDGLNVQVYNRCIGTRTCSSYCPYKVRHFNWFNYTGDDPEELRAVRNPDVTVRTRGVMEKCTYCVQRISAARIAADRTGRAIEDGEIRTACQQACPTQAIVFGDVTAPDSAVSRRKADPRNYSLLKEANTRPRTTYLARIEDDVPPGGDPGDG